jgi:hypothetical protein
MVETADVIWADGPSSMPNQPAKSKIRAYLKWIEGVIGTFLGNSGLAYTSRAALFADLAHAANSSAWVIGDATVAYNGVYVKSGASGTGSWTRVSDLPFSFIIANDAGAGTPNAKQATTSLPVSGSALVWMTIAATNAGTPVTVQFNSGAVLTVKTNAGNNPVAGGLVAGMTVMGIVSGSTFRLLSDQASAAIVSAAEGYALAAQAAAAGVTLPSAVASTYLRQKTDLTGYETRTPTQVAGDLNVQQRNVDSGFTMHATTTTQDWSNGRYAGGWQAAHRLSSADDATISGSRATFAVDRKVQGSGTNGPSFSDCGQYISVSKKNYIVPSGSGLTPNGTQGEIDGLYVFAGQSKLGDVAGILIGVEKTGGGSGAALALEASCGLVDDFGNTVRRLQTAVNFAVESGGGVSGGAGYGFWTEAQINGAYSAFHADQAKTATGALWQNLITFCEDRDAAKMIFKVDGTGHGLANGGTQGSPSWSFVLDPDTGIYNPTANQLGLSTGGAVRAIAANNGFNPGTDNAYSLGVASTGRWANIYTVNAPTVGSDERLKIDVIDAPLGLDFVLSQRPVAYKLLHGGTEIQWVEEEVEEEELVTVEGEVIREERYFNGAEVVIIEHKEIGQIPVYDQVHAADPRTGELLYREIAEPQYDGDGNPLVNIIPQDPMIVRSQNGDLIEIPRPHIVEPVTVKVTKPLMHSVQQTRKVTKVIRKPIEVEVAGKRQHFGLIAQEVKAALPEGIDFGGWIQDDMNDPGSLQSLRYEQFIPILIKAVQELSVRVKELENV